MYLNNTRYYYWLIIYFKVKHVISFNSHVQKAPRLGLVTGLGPYAEYGPQG